MKKARKAGLLPATNGRPPALRALDIGRELFDLAAQAQSKGWSAEDLLRTEARKRERDLRRKELASNRQAEMQKTARR